MGAPNGSRNGRARLSPAEVLHARTLAAAGGTARELAVLFGCRHTTVWQAVTGRTWAHLGGAVPGAVSARARRLDGATRREIGRRLAAGEAGAALAAEYGVCRKTIWRIASKAP